MLITNVKPLTIWMYTKPYIRFSSEDYDMSKLSNKFQHLTNATINKEHGQFNRSEKKGAYTIEGNMWEGCVFAEYLEERYAERFGPNVMQNIVVP